MENKKEVIRDIARVLNKYSMENASNTPDFILAHYLVNCLEAWNGAHNAREDWYGEKVQDQKDDLDFVNVE